LADITWTAYALAMFTPEQLQAAVNAQPDEEPILRPLPPPPAPATSTGAVVGGRVIIDGMSYDPNTPQQLQYIYSKGWRYEGGRWIAPGSLGTVATPDQDPSRPPGLASIPSASTVAGASVLGTTVPSAPPVLLPSFVGGRIGVVRMGGGMRPESGGNPDRIRFGNPSVLPVVRMQDAGGGGGGGSW